MRAFIGIDPGLSGGLALIGEDGALIQAVPMPRLQGSSGPLDMYAIKEWFAWTKRSYSVSAAIERVSVRPKEGIRSALTTGTNWGFIKGMLIAISARHEEPTPQQWKKELGLPKRPGSERKLAKQDAVVLANRLFPGIDLTPGRKRVPHDGMADAVLIAEYARRKLS